MHLCNNTTYTYKSIHTYMHLHTYVDETCIHAYTYSMIYTYNLYIQHLYMWLWRRAWWSFPCVWNLVCSKVPGRSVRRRCVVRMWLCAHGSCDCAHLAASANRRSRLCCWLAAVRCFASFMAEKYCAYCGCMHGDAVNNSWYVKQPSSHALYPVSRAEATTQKLPIKEEVPSGTGETTEDLVATEDEAASKERVKGCIHMCVPTRARTRTRVHFLIRFSTVLVMRIHYLTTHRRVRPLCHRSRHWMRAHMLMREQC